MSYTRLIGIGAFVLGGLALFVFGLFLIGSRRNMFSSRFEVYTEFTKMAALQRGGKVRVAGMDAGEVDSIMVPAKPSARFRVKMLVRGDLHQLVRTDSIATIQTDGIVGNKFVEIDAGTDTAPPVPDGSTIVGKDPFEFADLIEQASGGITTIIGTINDLKGDVQQLITSTTKTTDTANKMLQSSSDDVKAMTTSARAIARNLQDITNNISHGKGSLGKLMNDDELYKRVAAIAKQAEDIGTQLKATVTAAHEAVDKFSGKGGGAQAMQGMQSDLQQTLTYAREAMANLAENTEALKRNFLFRGMFNQRGFYGLDAIAPDEYRAGTFIGGDRQALRISLGASVLFAAGPNGEETLTPDGRLRIDRAMATFLRYPPDTPLIVEGYSTLPTTDLQLLQSRARALLVRSYVIGRFGLSINLVGMVPLGADAPDAPSGDGHWDGIGLASWVRRDAFAPGPEKAGTAKAGAAKAGTAKAGRAAPSSP
jgi:phospholipid/cholesterol/gamma-HCH transport system substrate-binding protein